MVQENINIEEARICFRNFSGAEGKFNPKGSRNFGVFIDDDSAKMLEKDGWNIRYLKSRDEEEPPQAWLPVKISFDHIPPEVYLIRSNGKVKLGEDQINILDWAEIKNIDITIRPYNWEVNGKAGVKAYVKKMFVTIVEDKFDDKYYDVPDSAQSTLK